MNLYFRVSVFHATLALCAATCGFTAHLLAQSSPTETTSQELFVEAQPKEGGTVVGQGRYPIGKAVEVIAVPKEHYRFAYWAGAVVTNPNNPKTNIYISSQPQRLVAAFEPEKFLLTITTEPSQAGDVRGGGYIPYGAMAPVSVKAYGGFVFDRWEGPVADKSSDTTMLASPLKGPLSLVARFKPEIKQYTLSATVEPAGAGTIEGLGTFDRGVMAKVKAIPAKGYLFNGWEGPVSRAGREETEAFINGDIKLKARFIAKPAWVSAKVSPLGAGKIEGDLGAQPVGKICKIKALPEAGYIFDHWGNGVSNSYAAETTFTPTEGKTVELHAYFRPIQ
ncbi:MAG: hypothetical protein LBV12_06830 [Puniceicoccales bacterium]|jgi:hypothetical protein|nr:hypothetical protein [Puniceicoccales bacterium]